MKFKFPWTKPTAKEVIEEIFSGFTPEEIAILDADDCVLPNMYTFLLSRAHNLRTRRTMKEIKELAQKQIYPLKKRDLRDPVVQLRIRDVFIWGIFCEGDYIY